MENHFGTPVYKLKFYNNFWLEFTLAEKFGVDGIKSTFKKIFKAYRNNYVDLTELVLVLNCKNREHHQENVRFAKLYNKLYEDANDYAIQNLKHEQLDYYFKNID